VFDLGGGVRLLEELARAYRGPDLGVPPDPGEDAQAERPAGARVASLGRLVARLARPATRLAESGSGASSGYVLTERRVDAGRLDPRMIVDATWADLIVAAGHRAIADFNAEAGERAARVVLLTAIGTPRSRVTPRPIENAWVATQNATVESERDDPRRLLEAISAQRRRSREKEAPALAASLQTASTLPVWAKRLAGAVHPLTRHRLEETAAVTYLGEAGPFDFGSAGVSTALFLDGPARAPKGLFIGGVMHEGLVCIGYRGNAAQLDDTALGRLADLHLDALLALGEHTA
jgi:hypothetical protein